MYLEVSQVGEALRDGGEVVTIENDSGEGQTTWEGDRQVCHVVVSDVKKRQLFKTTWNNQICPLCLHAYSTYMYARQEI